MAGEWIKVRTNLWNDPRVSQLCDLTSSSEAMIVGGLYWLWATADEHTETGLMPGLSISAVDRKTGINGFGSALVAIGWVQDAPEGIVLARFDEHNGASAKARAQTAKRVSNSRNNAPVTPIAQNCNAATVTGALPREEKRREESKNKPKSKAPASGSRLPDDWKPDQADIEYCKTERPDLRPSLVATNFYDYWIAQPGAKGRKADWSATWRSWVRKESAAAAPRAGPAGYQSANDKAKTLADRLTGKTRNEPAFEFIDINASPA